MLLRTTACAGVVLAVCAWLCACVSARPSIGFTVVPEAGIGGPTRTGRIAGWVKGAKQDERIVLFAKSGVWWVQPRGDVPFTTIRKDSTWENETHIGTSYAALLVHANYTPPMTTSVLPAAGSGIVAVGAVEGKPAPAEAQPAKKIVLFSGYEWEVRQTPSDSGGTVHTNLASNVWTDAQGRLHLRIAHGLDDWTCAEINLTRSLGYGRYTFAVEKSPGLEPGTVFAMFTWDDLDTAQNHREIDLQLSQWGDPTIKNAQFVIQPFYVAANVFRFVSPHAALTYSFDWEPGRVTMRTEERGRNVAEHVFTSGVPAPGAETVHMNFYIYGKSRISQKRGSEVVVEKFAFLP